MIGSINAVIIASRLRLEIRTPRAIIVRMSVPGDDGRTVGMASSDIGKLLSGGGLISGVVGPGSGGGPAGQRQEDVVQRRAVQVEPAEQIPARVNLIEDLPDMGGGPVGSDSDHAALGLRVDG